MFETKSAEKVTIETQKKPLMICGFLGVFWNVCTGVKKPVKESSEGNVPPEAQIEPFCDRNTCTTVAAPAAEKKVLLEKFEHLHAQGSIGASRKMHYGPEDHLGSTRMVLAQDGTVKEALMYQPYGAVSDVQGITPTGNDPLRQKFTTKEFDEDGQLDLGLIEFNIALDFALTHSDPDKPNRVAVYYIDAPAKPDIVNITIDPATNKGKLNAVLKNATSRTVASIQFKLNDDAVTCNVENIAEITNPGSKLIIEQTFTDVSGFLPTVPKTFLNYSNRSFYLAGIGQYYFGARYLDPDLGIWTSKDPKEQFFSPYVYAGNGTNPIAFTDKDGMDIGISWSNIDMIIPSSKDLIIVYNHALPIFSLCYEGIGRELFSIAHKYPGYFEYVDPAVYYTAFPENVSPNNGWVDGNPIYTLMILPPKGVFGGGAGKGGTAVAEGAGVAASTKVGTETGSQLVAKGINAQKLAGHIEGTPQYLNRAKSGGKTTSTFFGEKSAEKWTWKAWNEGVPTQNPSIKIYKPGVTTGTGSEGGFQTQVRVSIDKNGLIHGTPYGPVAQ